MLKGRDRKGPDRGGVAKLVGGAVILLGVLFAALILMGARPAAAQGLADFDYENLSIRGAALDVGYIFPTRVEATSTFGGRMDLGFLGPGVRVTAGFHRWSSSLKRSEVRKLENQVEELILEQTGDSVAVDLGRISWSDFAIHSDVHFLWRIPMGLYTYAGVGATAHVLRGSGPAIDDTFVEDLLDSVRAGINLHGGVEVPLSPRFRLVGETRWELLENLSYVQIRAGGQIMLGAWGQGGAGR
jgi:hypothetical protein